MRDHLFGERKVFSLLQEESSKGKYFFWVWRLVRPNRQDLAAAANDQE